MDAARTPLLGSGKKSPQGPFAPCERSSLKHCVVAFRRLDERLVGGDDAWERRRLMIMRNIVDRDYAAMPSKRRQTVKD